MYIVWSVVWWMYLGNYYGDENALIDDGLLYVNFGTIVLHFQPLGPTLQHLQERGSFRYWGARYLPPSFYNSAFGTVFTVKIK